MLDFITQKQMSSKESILYQRLFILLNMFNQLLMTTSRKVWVLNLFNTNFRRSGFVISVIELVIFALTAFSCMGVVLIRDLVSGHLKHMMLHNMSRTWEVIKWIGELKTVVNPLIEDVRLRLQPYACPHRRIGTLIVGALDTWLVTNHLF